MLGDYDKKSYVFTLKRGESLVKPAITIFRWKMNSLAGYQVKFQPTLWISASIGMFLLVMVKKLGNLCPQSTTPKYVVFL